MVRKTFSVSRKKPIDFIPTNMSEKRVIKYFSNLMTENFSMSEDLAKAIGTVVVQALTENAKDTDNLGGGGDMFGGGDDSGFDFDDFGTEGNEDLPESSKDAGTVEEAAGAIPAPDTDNDFDEMQSMVNNHSEKGDSKVRNAFNTFFDMDHRRATI